MNRILFALIATLLPAGSHAAMLTNKTPDNFTVPSGWSIVRTQTFESACIPGENCGRAQGSRTTERAHTGKYSVGGQIKRDGDEIGYSYHVGTYRNLYMSWWIYVEDQARFTDEWYIARLVHDNGPNGFQEIIFDYMFADKYNSTTSQMRVEPEGHVSNNFGFQKQREMPRGAWTQIELWVRPNSPKKADGFTRMWVNGVRWDLGVENQNFTAEDTMQNVSIIIGGVYTKLIWMIDDPSIKPRTVTKCTKCSPAYGVGGDGCRNYMYGSGLWKEIDIRTPPACGSLISQPYFKVFYDDIIILKSDLENPPVDGGSTPGGKR